MHVEIWFRSGDPATERLRVRIMLEDGVAVLYPADDFNPQQLTEMYIANENGPLTPADGEVYMRHLLGLFRGQFHAELFEP